MYTTLFAAVATSQWPQPRLSQSMATRRPIRDSCLRDVPVRCVSPLSRLLNRSATWKRCAQSPPSFDGMNFHAVSACRSPFSHGQAHRPASKRMCRPSKGHALARHKIRQSGPHQSPESRTQARNATSGSLCIPPYAETGKMPNAANSHKIDFGWIPAVCMSRSH